MATPIAMVWAAPSTPSRATCKEGLEMNLPSSTKALNLERESGGISSTDLAITPQVLKEDLLTMACYCAIWSCRPLVE